MIKGLILTAVGAGFSFFISVVTLDELMRLPINGAIFLIAPILFGISITVVFFASLVGTAGYIYNGWGHSFLPRYAWGFVYPFGAVLAGIPSVFLAYTGAHLAHKTHPTRLRKIFAFLLLGTGVRMLF